MRQFPDIRGRSDVRQLPNVRRRGNVRHQDGRHPEPYNCDNPQGQHGKAKNSFGMEQFEHEPDPFLLSNAKFLLITPQGFTLGEFTTKSGYLKDLTYDYRIYPRERPENDYNGRGIVIGKG